MDYNDRDFNIMRRFVITFIAIVFLLVFGGIGVYTYAAVKVVNNVTENCPDGLAKCAGRVVGEFQKGVKEFQKGGE